MISQLFTAGSFWSNPLLQSTVCIAVGLIASWFLRRRSARAHQVLLLSMIAAVAVPVMSMIVRHYKLGIFVDKPAVIKVQLAEIPIVPLTTEYEISPLPAIPGAYYPEPIESIEPEYSIPSGAVSSEAKKKLPLSTILMWSWIIVSTILAARLFVTFILGLRMLQRAFPLRCEKLDKALLIAKGKLGIDKPVQVLTGQTISSPVIWCWSRRPALLVPADAAQFEDGVDWVGMFCHELAHWSRLDHISGLFSELMVCVFPWHPLMWWAKSRLAGLSEQACDDWVVAGSRSPADYAESLLDLSPQRQLSFLPAVVGRKNGLESRIRRIVKDKCGKPNLGMCWAVVVTLIAACITISAAFAQTRPADTDKAKECEKLLAEQPKNELHAQKLELLDQQREMELINQQQELQGEQKHLEQLVNQLQLEKSKLRKTTESTVHLRLEQLKHLNALAHQQAEYQKQADIIESEIQLFQHATAKAKKHHVDDLPGHVVDTHEHETRELQFQELVTELRALRAKINNIESLLQATILELYGQTTQRSQLEQTTRSDPFTQIPERDQLAQYKRILEIESDNLKQELDVLDGLRQEAIEKAETHEQMRATLEAIDKNRHRIRMNVPPTLIDEELFKDDELTILKKLRGDLQIHADKTRLKLEGCRDKKETDKLRGVLDNINAFIKYIDGRIPDYLRSREQAKRSELSFCIERQKLIDHRSELEERKSQLKRQLEIAPEGKEAKDIRLELELIEVEMLDINNRLNAMSQEQRLKYKAKSEAKRQRLLLMRQGLEDMAKEIQRRLKDDSIRIDVARHKAELDKIDKRIRKIDFELSSPQWCPEKRKAEQMAAKQQYDSDLERAKSEYDTLIKRKDHTVAELKNREAEWWAELRAFEADVVTAKQIIRDVNAVLENDQAMLKQINQEIKNFTSEHGANLDSNISLYNKLKTMEANRDQLSKKIERDKVRLAKYQDELKAAVERRDIYLKYKPPAGTEEEDIRRFIKEKEALERMYDPWHTTPPGIPPGRDFPRRQHIQTTPPPSQQGQAYSPWQQPEEKLQSRINQLQDEISRLRSEMTELRKIMKDMVEQEKKRPQPSLFIIDKDPIDIGENPPEKPLPEIHMELPGPENIEPESSENKASEHPPDDIPIEPEEIETIELIPPAD